MNPPPHDSLSRRRFLGLGTQAALASALPMSTGLASAANSDTLVTQLYRSLNRRQKKELAFAYDDPLRQKVDNNWHVTKHAIHKILDDDQVDLVRQIFDGLHSEEYKSEVWRQFDQDNRRDGGFGSASIALFGEPGSGQFEFVLTGRHCTRRCDGDSEAGVAFGGPIFYGHAAEDFYEEPHHPGNAYWFQAKRANEVFKALDGKQREAALLGKSRGERGTRTVQLTGIAHGLDGLAVGDMTSDQQDLVKAVLTDLLKPFREADAAEAAKLISASGFEDLHMAFYKNEDVGDDGVWDTWQIEGPNMVWYFRGDPHVHCWAHVRGPVDA